MFPRFAPRTPSATTTLLGRELRLDPALAAVALAIDGRRDVDDVLAAACTAGLTRPLAVRGLRALLLLNVIEGAGDAVIASLRAFRDGLDLPRGRVLPEMRFECQGSGSCCQTLSLGPLDAADVERLAALDLSKSHPHLVGQSLTELHAHPDGRRAPYLRRVDGRCLLQLDDGRCGVHVHHGAAAKPLTCRLFPLEHVVRYDGVHVYDRGECSRFGASSKAGEPLARTPQRLLPLMAQTRRLDHPIVQLSPSYLADFGYYAPLVQSAVDECAADTLAAPEVLRALARRVAAFTGALDGLPLSPGAAGAALQHVLATPRARFYVPCRPENLVPGARALRAVAEALTVACDRVLEQIPEGHGQSWARDFARRLKPVLHVVRTLLAALLEPQSAPERIIDAGFLSADTPEAHDTLRRSLRQALFGRQALVDDRALPALLRLAFVQLVTVYAARHRDAGEASRASIGGLDEGHQLAVRALSLDPMRQVFIEAAEAAPAALEALPYVLRWR